MPSLFFPPPFFLFLFFFFFLKQKLHQNKYKYFIYFISIIYSIQLDLTLFFFLSKTENVMYIMVHNFKEYGGKPFMKTPYMKGMFLLKKYP